MCEQCNPLGLKAPAASQAHGTAILGVAVAVVVLAVLARFAVSGIGPFPSSVLAVVPDPAGLRLTISVTNDGSSPAATTCRISDPKSPGIGPDTTFIQSPVIQPGATQTFETVVVTLGSEPKPLAVACGK
jgi:hypothetical protein